VAQSSSVVVDSRSIVATKQGKERRDQGAVRVQEGPPPRDVRREGSPQPRPLLHHPRVRWSSQLSHEVSRSGAPHHHDAQQGCYLGRMLPPIQTRKHSPDCFPRIIRLRDV
jgi:hypothetical protein